jgi:hypothetical protein
MLSVFNAIVHYFSGEAVLVLDLRYERVVICPVCVIDPERDSYSRSSFCACKSIA